MGGWGSGTWDRDSRKARVEECLKLDVGWLSRKGYLRPLKTGTLALWEIYPRIPVDSVRYLVEPHWESGFIFRLYYRDSTGESVVLPIRMQTTYPHFGGVRWWFTCPLIVDGKACERRVSALYLCGRYFGCRNCHRLTYRSCQEAHKIDREEASRMLLLSGFGRWD